MYKLLRNVTPKQQWKRKIKRRFPEIFTYMEKIDRSHFESEEILEYHCHQKSGLLFTKGYDLFTPLLEDSRIYIKSFLNYLYDTGKNFQRN